MCLSACREAPGSIWRGTFYFWPALLEEFLFLIPYPIYSVPTLTISAPGRGWPTGEFGADFGLLSLLQPDFVATGSEFGAGFDSPGRDPVNSCDLGRNGADSHLSRP